MACAFGVTESSKRASERSPLPLATSPNTWSYVRFSRITYTTCRTGGRAVRRTDGQDDDRHRRVGANADVEVRGIRHDGGRVLADGERAAARERCLVDPVDAIARASVW